MSLAEKINQDLVTAMKAKDQVGLRGIRAIKAALLLQKTDGSGQEMNEEREIQLLQKLVKQRQDSLDIYVQQNRPDLAQTEREEIEVIQRYLPTQLDAEELAERLRAIIAQVGATSARDMGKVMGQAQKELAGQADGKAIAAVVKSLLG